jgi:hypothetical protein
MPDCKSQQGREGMRYWRVGGMRRTSREGIIMALLKEFRPAKRKDRSVSGPQASAPPRPCFGLEDKKRRAKRSPQLEIPKLIQPTIWPSNRRLGHMDVMIHGPCHQASLLATPHRTFPSLRVGSDREKDFVKAVMAFRLWEFECRWRGDHVGPHHRFVLSDAHARHRPNGHTIPDHEHLLQVPACFYPCACPSSGRKKYPYSYSDTTLDCRGSFSTQQVDIRFCCTGHRIILPRNDQYYLQ